MNYNGLAYCTSGFSCKNSAGTKGILTAGHAANSLTYNGAALPMISEQNSGAVDAQWHTTAGYTPKNWIWDGYSGRSITAVENRADQVQGEYVAKYGITTGFTWGYIVSTTYCPPEHLPFFILVHRDGANLSEGGDSGGPWFSGNTVYGIHTGGNGNDAYYMAVDPYAQFIGVTVMASP